MQVIKEEGSRPIKAWTQDIEPKALVQVKNLARLPFIAGNGVALMPDVHAGIGSTVGSVIATRKAIIPAAVGVDIGCGMIAVRTSLTASALPDNLKAVRSQIERDVPLGTGGQHTRVEDVNRNWNSDARRSLLQQFSRRVIGPPLAEEKRLVLQLGTLGSGNHFIELCLDEEDRLWVMLHSGSRGIGNLIGRYFIELAKRDMERYFITLPDSDLAYLPEGSEHYDDYIAAVRWAQEYAKENREVMLERVLQAMVRHLPDFFVQEEAVNCHHNYIAQENHFGDNVWVTRKGAIRARVGDLGIIPGSMGTRSYIVCGKGHPESYCSCSHGAGRRMSRTAARKYFTVEDLAKQTEGVECRKDDGVLDEIPGAYKDIDEVMANQADLVEIRHTIRQIMCVKG